MLKKRGRPQKMVFEWKEKCLDQTRLDLLSECESRKKEVCRAKTSKKVKKSEIS